MVITTIETDAEVCEKAISRFHGEALREVMKAGDDR